MVESSSVGISVIWMGKRRENEISFWRKIHKRGRPKIKAGSSSEGNTL